MKRRGSKGLLLLIFLGLLRTDAWGASSFATLLTFNGTNGGVPEATLIQASDGFLYGTTLSGGTNDLVQGGYGTVFRISTNGDFTSLYSFSPKANPQSGVLEAPDGYFYGVADYGGNGSGSCYRLSPSGQFTQLYSFTPEIGGYPHGLTLGPDKAFYGTGIYGGADFNSLGTIFKITQSGVPTVLASFHGTNGSYPQARVLLASDGNFYGTTTQGGAFGLGTLFKITLAGALSTLVSFNGTNGANPVCALMQGTDGLIYGTTYGGGIDFNGPGYSGNGTIFSIDTNGLFTTLYQFKGYPDDASRPSFGALLQSSDGSFYGTSEAGGSGASGTVFRMGPGHTVRVVYSFSRPDYATATNADGWEPSAGLVQAGEEIFYGVTMRGGAHDLGVVYRLTILPDPPVLVGLVSAGAGQVRLTWNGVPGASYELQSNTNLALSEWQRVAVVLATNTVTSISDKIQADAHRWYRVKQLP